MIDSKTWLDRIDAVRYNPSAIMRTSLDAIESVLNGTATLGDSTNPFVLALETSAVNAAACMIDSASNTRKQYASMATTPEELYLHMSDVDYADRFATPARATMSVMMSKEEAIARAVPTGVDQTRKLVIPRHTQFTVNNVNFTMQYPIEIRVMGHGGLQIVYNNDSLSPLETLSSNLVDWEILNYRGVEFITLRIPVAQFTITSFKATGNQASSFVKRWTFTDQFYYARAYYADDQGRWHEMITTHTDQVFDPLKPTALLHVFENQVRMTVPQIYQTTGLVGSEFRLDVYTTKGPIEMVLSDYPNNEFSARWVDLENSDGGIYSAPLSAFNYLILMSDDTVAGGSNALSFEELRERTMGNSNGPQDIPITNAQMSHRLKRLGYDMVRNVDNITNRQFLATRALSAPTDGSVSSGMACTIQTLTSSMRELAQMPTVIDNGDRITLMPSTLYRIEGGIVEVVPQTTVDSIMALPIDVRARRINDGQYLYSPFHYVLDRTLSRFEHRPYHLGSPQIVSKSFIEENDTTGIQVSSKSFSIERTETGYEITLIVESSDSWKSLPDEDVFCQLSFIPHGQKDRAYLNGELLGTVDKERTYLFRMDTNYDVDDEDNLSLISFSMYGDEPRPHAVALEEDFDVMFIARGLSNQGLVSSNIDLQMGAALLPEDAMGISQERLRVRLGVALKGLWNASRSIASSQDYERYPADVPAVYEETILKRDPVTGAVEIEMDAEGNVSFVTLHAKGDPVLDEAGNPIYRFRKGDVKLDASGQPIIVSSRSLQRQMDLLFLDGVYWFADQSTAVRYRESVPDTIAAWLKQDIEYLTAFLLEQTQLYFYPKSTLGRVQALVREAQQSSIAAAQSFAVTYYLSGPSYRDAALRTSLTDMAKQTIAEALQSPTVTMNGIVSRLTARAGNDIISVSVTGLGGEEAYSAVTLLDDSSRLSIRKVAVALADGTIGVEDDISVSFIQHTE